jgi:glutathione synthase/RimK-type ligase-like ATP-grasp enzyme
MIPIILRRRKLGRGSSLGIQHFSATGITPVRNDKAFPKQPSIIFRWGTTSVIPEKTPVVNTVEAIHFASDKRGSRKVFADAGIAPKTWLDIAEMDMPLRGPVVVRRATHHQGRWLHLCNDEASVRAAVGLYGANNYYISEYIPKVAEYRVFLCQGRVVWVAKKTPANAEAVAWNVAKGGRFDNVNWGDWPLKAVRIAREAFMMSKLDFGGVDIMVDKDNNCYVLEINSAPSQTSPYRQECTAKAFDYIVRNGKAVIPVTEARGDWKKFIHPAISEAAIMV